MDTSETFIEHLPLPRALLGREKTVIRQDGWDPCAGIVHSLAKRMDSKQIMT